MEPPFVPPRRPWPSQGQCCWLAFVREVAYGHIGQGITRHRCRPRARRARLRARPRAMAKVVHFRSGGGNGAWNLHGSKRPVLTVSGAMLLVDVCLRGRIGQGITTCHGESGIF